MQVMIYTDPAAFLERTRAFLERQEAYNNLPLGLAARLSTPDADTPDPFLATVEEQGKLALVALMTPPRRLILCTDSGVPRDALAALAEYLETSDWTVPGVLGPVEVAEAFAELRQQRTGLAYDIHMSMRVYQLTAVQHRGTAPGQLRPVCAADRDLVMQWTLAFHAAVSEEASNDDEELLRHVDRRIDQQTLFFWEDGGPVSMAARARPTRHGTVVNAVYTPPEKRNRGYATACVAAVSQLLLDEGQRFCALFADLANPISNSIYQRIGYRPLGDYVAYAFG